MHNLKYIAKLLKHKSTSSLVRRTIIIGSYQQKSPLSTAAAATEYADYPGVDAHTDHHAVVSTFDLFSIGVGPSSSHTVGPMRASKIFIQDLKDHDILEKVHTLRVGKVTQTNNFFYFSHC